MVNRIVCGGMVVCFVLVASPAMALDLDSGLYDADVGVGTEVGAGWSQTRAERASRSEQMRPIGVTRSPQRAVAYLRGLAEAGIGGYWRQCLKLADDAYMPKGPRVGTAFAQWYRAKDAGLAHPKDANPPLGAQMFWDPGHAAGHVATYVGDDKAVTNMSDGSVKIISWRKMNDWGPYLGWATPYYREQAGTSVSSED